MSNIGVFGGSFDPPHLGHKALVEAALHELALDEIWVMPVGMAVHRQLTSNISAEQRLAWVQTMFMGMDKVRVLDWEVTQARAVASIEVMRDLNEQLDSVPVWLMGMDAWLGLPDWIDYPEHAQWCNVAVFPRQDEKPIYASKLHAPKLHIGWQQVDLLSKLETGQVYWAHASLPAVSATQIRQDILTGKDASTVLDASIADEIQTAYMDKRSNGVNE